MRPSTDPHSFVFRLTLNSSGTQKSRRILSTKAFLPCILDLHWNYIILRKIMGNVHISVFQTWLKRQRERHRQVERYSICWLLLKPGTASTGADRAQEAWTQRSSLACGWQGFCCSSHHPLPPRRCTIGSQNGKQSGNLNLGIPTWNGGQTPILAHSSVALCTQFLKPPQIETW